MMCEDIGLKARSHARLWNYLLELQDERIININTFSEHDENRFITTKSLIEISHVPLAKLEQTVIKILDMRGIKFKNFIKKNS